MLMWLRCVQLGAESERAAAGASFRRRTRPPPAVAVRKEEGRRAPRLQLHRHAGLLRGRSDGRRRGGRAGTAAGGRRFCLESGAAGRRMRGWNYGREGIRRRRDRRLRIETATVKSRSIGSRISNYNSISRNQSQSRGQHFSEAAAFPSLNPIAHARARRSPKRRFGVEPLSDVKAAAAGPRLRVSIEVVEIKLKDTEGTLLVLQASVPKRTQLAKTERKRRRSRSKGLKKTTAN